MVAPVKDDRSAATQPRAPLSDAWVRQGRLALGNPGLSEEQVFTQITAWQTLFRQHGYYSGPVDGQWGKATQDALDKLTQQVLQKHGFYKGKIDGEWGDRSKAAMSAYLRNEPGAAPKLPTLSAQQFYVLAKEPAFRSAAQQEVAELLGPSPRAAEPLDPLIEDVLAPEHREKTVPATKPGAALVEPGSGLAQPKLPPANARAAAMRPAGDNPRDASHFRTADQWETQMNRWEKLTLQSELDRLGVPRDLFGKWAKEGAVPTALPTELEGQIRPEVWSTMVRPLVDKLAADYRRGIAEPRPDKMDPASLVFEMRHQARHIVLEGPSAYSDGARSNRLHDLTQAALKPLGDPVKIASVNEHQTALTAADAYRVLGEQALKQSYLLGLEDSPDRAKIAEAEAAARDFHAKAAGLLKTAEAFEDAGGLVGASDVTLAMYHSAGLDDLARRLPKPAK